ncbi:3-ketosteroid dehydrogenase [Hyaloscypha variabilis]
MASTTAPLRPQVPTPPPNKPPNNSSSKIEASTSTPNPQCSILIIGAGATGLLASLRAHHQGLTPLLIEKTPFLGGTSSLSGGSVWIPCNPITFPPPTSTASSKPSNQDSLPSALTYLTTLIDPIGPVSSLERKLAFLTQGPKMVEWLREVGFKWISAPRFPDYYPEVEGVSLGRSVEGEVFDAKKLGEWEALMARSETQTAVAVYASESNVFPIFWRTWGLFFLFLKIVLVRTIGWSMLGRKPVTMGRSLVAQLMLLVKNRGVEVWRETELVRLLVEEGKVVGAAVKREGKEFEIRASKGVLLCAGGFARNLEMRREYFQAPASDEWTMVPPPDTGDAIRAGQEIGAATALMDDAWWYPTFVNPRTGERHLCPYERCLPHGIIVDSSGKRFMSEAQSYFDCGQQQYERNKTVPTIPAWLVMDSQHRKKYLLWKMLPGRTSERAFTDGWLKKAASLSELAEEIGVDAEGLTSTVTHFNKMAAKGTDDDFNRGTSLYDQYYGDPTMTPNPNLGTIELSPFYAIQIWPGDLGTKGGLLTDEYARVVRENGEVIPGLYAAGNTAASVMGRTYPGPGSTLGPAMTFAFIAVDHAASENLDGS